MIPILRASDAGELKRRVMNRSQLQNEEVSRIVKEIVARVRQEGDAALFDYTAKFDHVTMTAETVLVTKDEIARAYAAASLEWLDAMREAARRITAFHEKQKQNTWLNFDPAISLGQKITPLKRVGVYVPGGTAAYPSSVLMNVLPAKVAGVKEIVMVTPPGRDGSVSYPLALVAADLAGVDKIYKVLPLLMSVRRKMIIAVAVKGIFFAQIVSTASCGKPIRSIIFLLSFALTVISFTPSNHIFHTARISQSRPTVKSLCKG